MKLKIVLLCALMLILFPVGAQSTKNADKKMQRSQPVLVKWYVGFGRGDESAMARRIADEFNNSQDDIILTVVCVCGGFIPSDMLNSIYYYEGSLDIVGPTIFAWATEFTQTDWLDLQPFVDSHGYDLSQFPPNIVEAYRTPSGGLSALPFVAYPGVLYYNVDLFDAAGLNYPPTVAGEPYIMPDGSAVAWDYDTVADIGKLLTLDSAGHHAAHAEFNPNDIIQYGFVHQWQSARSNFHTFGDAPLVDAEGRVVITDAWRAQAQWLWDGIWKDYFIPSNAYLLREEIDNQNAFAYGRVAMARSMAWYLCCLDSLEARWDIAIQPAYQGTIFAPADFDSFQIHRSTQHPEEAFVVLQYLLDVAAPELIPYYESFPARTDLHAAAFDRYRQQYPDVQQWEVFTTSMQFTPTIPHDAVPSHYAYVQDRFGEFLTLLSGENGANIDLDAELDRLQADLQAIIDDEG